MLITKLLGAFYRIPLSNILGTKGVGVYQMVFSVYSLFLVFITGAMPVFISQKVSCYRAKNDTKNLSALIKNAVFLCFILGVLSAVVLSLFSSLFAAAQQIPYSTFCYVIVATSIVFSAVTSVYRGYFQGFENMTPSAIGGIIEQTLKLVFGLVLSFYLKRYGAIYSVYGAFLGVDISEIFCFCYVYFNFKKHQNCLQKSYIKYIQVKNIFFEFLPISLAGIILPISACIDSFVVVNLLNFSGIEIGVATSMFGIATGMINPLVNFPIILSGTVATSFLPTLTYKISKNEDTKTLTSGTYFFVWFVCLPCVAGIIALASNIIYVFFPAIELAYRNVSVYYLTVSAFNIIWLSVSQVSVAILNAYGKFKYVLFSQFMSMVLKFLLFIVFVIIGKMNIVALCFATTLSNAFCCVINLLCVKKMCEFSVQIKQSIFCFVCSFIMSASVVILNSYIKFSILSKTVMLVGFGIMEYLILSVFLKTISLQKIKQLFVKSNSNLIKDTKK
ncbi:MAG: oligosaccharide flippase family protein [Clostridia bacterium]|nr:oligosaccharide flippase family protein [Clostridia bacterium]